jgi:hypothetical protein
MSQDNNISVINANNYSNLNNQYDTVEWFIDTTPNYHLTNNNIQSVRRIYSGASNQFIYEVNRNNNIETIREDDFIPFGAQNIRRISIDIEVCKFLVSEEESNCCICYETKDFEDISQINCSHKFCGTCLINHISINHINPCCPLCRVKICHIQFQRHFYANEF